jgi:hypothetical protein
MLGLLSACATVPFERYVSQQRWPEAAAAFDADSSLLHSESALFDAAMLFSSPLRGTYAPDKARSLFQRLFALDPNTRHRVAAADRLALMDSIDTERRRASARLMEVQGRIALLEADTLRLRIRLDSALAARAAEEKSIAVLEAELRQLRLELARLKEIDLKTRRPP